MVAEIREGDRWMFIFQIRAKSSHHMTSPVTAPVQGLLNMTVASFGFVMREGAGALIIFIRTRQPAPLLAITHGKTTNGLYKQASNNVRRYASKVLI